VAAARRQLDSRGTAVPRPRWRTHGRPGSWAPLAEGGLQLQRVPAHTRVWAPGGVSQAVAHALERRAAARRRREEARRLARLQERHAAHLVGPPSAPASSGWGPDDRPEPALAGEAARLSLDAPRALDAGMFNEDVIADIRLLTTKVILMGK
jgi:hypothetical protein